MKNMTKNQAWIIIGLIVVIIAMWGIRNQNENETLQNKLMACYQVCATAYYDSAEVKVSVKQALDTSQSCKSKCNMENGLDPLPPID